MGVNILLHFLYIYQKLCKTENNLALESKSKCIRPSNIYEN